MSILLRAKRTLCCSPIRHSLNFTAYRTPLLPPRCFSSPATQIPNFTLDYFISNFGFSPDKAAKAYKPIAHLKSPEKPDSVLRFLNEHGFVEADIKTLITKYPQILCSSPENTLYPNLLALREIGLSTSALTNIILTDPQALHLRTAVPRIKFLNDFLGGSEAALLTAFKNNRCLASHDTVPNISILQTRHGLSISEIRRIVITVPRFIISSIHTMEDGLVRTKELGFQSGSPMFVCGLQAVFGNSRDMLQKKMQLLKSCGWSEDNFFSALRRYPLMVKISRNSLESKMDFLTGEVGCDLSYIVSTPQLLTCSLEKRIKPRHHVLSLLKSSGLDSKKQDFYSATRMTDSKFVEKYILPHKGEISGLLETYLAACA